MCRSSCSQKNEWVGRWGLFPSSKGVLLYHSHNTKVSFLYSPHNLHPISKNFHVHRESTIGMSHKIEIREFSLERKKLVTHSHITQNDLICNLDSWSQIHLFQLTCSTLMSISPWIFFPLKYFALEKKSRAHPSILKSQEDRTQVSPLSLLSLQCH